MTRIITPRQWWREHLQSHLDAMFERINDDLADRTDVADFLRVEHPDVMTAQPPAHLRPRSTTAIAQRVSRSA